MRTTSSRRTQWLGFPYVSSHAVVGLGEERSRGTVPSAFGINSGGVLDTERDYVRFPPFACSANGDLPVTNIAANASRVDRT